MTKKTDSANTELLNKIFDAAPALLSTLAPEGWAKSPFVHFLHPTPQQQYEQYKQINENLRLLSGSKNKEAEKEQPEDFLQDDLTNIHAFEEFIYVLGLSVWDIFSNNHEVVGQSAVYDFGSFRGSARFIADFLNEKFYHNTGKYGYLDFYMGTFAISSRGDLLPFYQFVFSVLQSENCDWKYHFPRLFLFNLHKGDAEQDTQKPDEYNPEKAIVAEMEKKQKEAELKKFQDELEGAFQDEYEEAKYKPLIPVVQAYKNVFGKLPEGHPQKEFE